VTACTSGAQQLAGTLPGYAGGQSLLAGNSALLGSGYGDIPGRPAYPNGGNCPNMVICAGTGSTDHAYREVNIDSGALSRSSELRFLIEPGQAESLATAQVDSLALVSVKFEDSVQPALNHQVILHVEAQTVMPGKTERELRLRAVRVDEYGQVLESGGAIQIDAMSSIRLAIQSSSNKTSHFSIWIDDDVLFAMDPGLSAQFGRPVLLRYGHLGMVSFGQRSEPVVAFVAGDWNIDIGGMVDQGRR
jgi:hypothetical protein